MKKFIRLVVSTTLLLTVAVANATSITLNEVGKIKDEGSLKEIYLKEKFKEENFKEMTSKKKEAKYDKVKDDKAKEEKALKEKAKNEKAKNEKSKNEKSKEEKSKEEKAAAEKAKEQAGIPDLISCKTSDGCGLDVINGVDDLVKPPKDQDNKLVDSHCNESSPSLCQINNDSKLSSIPEPATYALFAIGAVGLISFIKRQTNLKKVAV